DAGKLQWRAQEALAHITAIGRVVTPMASGVLIVKCAMSRTGIDELSSHDAAGPHKFAVAVERLEHHCEAISRAQVAMEIDLARKDLRELNGDAVTQP